MYGKWGLKYTNLKHKWVFIDFQTVGTVGGIIPLLLIKFYLYQRPIFNPIVTNSVKFHSWVIFFMKYQLEHGYILFARFWSLPLFLFLPHPNSKEKLCTTSFQKNLVFFVCLVAINSLLYTVICKFRMAYYFGFTLFFIIHRLLWNKVFLIHWYLGLLS